MNNKLSFFALISLLLLGFVCAKEYTFLQPAHFPKPSYNFASNPLHTHKIELGRLLFYDPILSQDNSISCASCHSPYNAFAHTDHDLSHGIKDQIGNRNAPALFNLAWQSTFMWDGAINHLDVQALAPISHPKEMSTDLVQVVAKLQQHKAYPQLFAQAFGDTLISGARVLKALAQFQLTLISATAKYDKVKRGQAVFNAQEARGYLLFTRNCNICHQEPLFSTLQFARNGLAPDTTLNDYGKATISHKKEDSLFFKIPSLRNLSYSYPYMHDGRFNTLFQVLDHYNQSKTLAIQNAKTKPHLIQLSANDKVDLIAFLLTLDDSSFIMNPVHHFPKKLLTLEKDL